MLTKQSTGSSPAREVPTADRFGWLEALGDTADGFFVVDQQQRIVRWNRGAERLLGNTADDVLGRSCYEVIAGGGRNGQAICGPDCPVRRCVNRGELPHGIEVAARTRGGRQVWLHLSVIVIPSESGPLRAHLLLDVSDRRRAAEVVAQVASLCQPGEVLPRDECGRSGQRTIVSAPEAAEASFTAREREVLRLMTDGLSNRAIASRLGVSANTVRNHVQHILTKSGSHSRSEAVSFALRRRLR
jgi:PAS domain S-box-containing protein